MDTTEATAHAHMQVSCTGLGGEGMDVSERQVSALVELIFPFGRKIFLKSKYKIQ